MRIIKHFNLITRHKWIVLKLCFKCGLFWRGIFHDMSKYSYTEFWESAKYFVGNKSPISECRRMTGKSEAWLHHKGRNKHHPEYWIDHDYCVMMPYKYAVESICDRIAASKTYNGKKYTNSIPLEYWNKQKKNFYINEKTSLFFDKVLKDLADKGEEYILNKIYMKTIYKRICE